MLINIYKTLFWLSVFMIFYPYFGYPLLLSIFALLRNKPINRKELTPFVSFVITAYNEEKHIAKKIENTLSQDYPMDKLEIIVASDFSTDRTDDIVKSYETRGVRLVRAPRRLGKESTQKYAVDAARGKIIVFSDVATILDAFGVRNIVKNFNDPTIGCVSSEDRFVDREGNVSGEGAYVKYEMLLRRLESRVNTLVGLSGSFFAVRRELCEPWAIDLQSDFNTLINSVKRRYRGVCDGSVIGYYQDLAESKHEFNRKVRTIARGIRVFMRSLPMLNIFKYGLFSWQFFSHKFCRWVVPFWMIIAFVTNFLLLRSSLLFFGLFILQLAFYVLSLVGTITKTKKLSAKLPSFFVTVNLSILVAWYKYLRGERFIKWEPSAR